MKGQRNSVETSSSQEEGSSLYSIKCRSNNMEQLDIVFLGAPECGKTSIIRQFINGSFNAKYIPTKQASLYTSAFVYQNQLYEMNIIDIPSTPFCPPDGAKKPRFGTPSANHFSWEDLQAYAAAISGASVLVFVYDITSSESFQFVTDLREQILECFDPDATAVELPMMVVAGNKHDLHKFSRLARRHISHMVRKTWKCSYLECSALFNWHIGSIFHEAVRLVKEGPAREGSNSHYRLPIRAWKQCSCNIL
ncbi:ras-like protein family member 10A [Apostichopus japonicus]|uniref:ras-like protein family member 10A n=1 Tax=Stichopus japonicus TaxID=307972 RepID=UPI003AB7E054